MSKGSIARLRMMKTMPTLRGIRYLRASHDGQGREASVESQEDEGEEFFQQFGIEHVATFCDNHLSASPYATEERPEFIRLRAALEAGQANLVWTFDHARMLRDLKVYTQLRDLLIEVGCYWAYGGRIYDMTDPADRRATARDAAEAEGQSDTISINVKRGVKRKARAGEPAGPVAFGYRVHYDPETGDSLGWLVDEDQKAVIREIVNDCMAGKPLTAIARKLNERGVPCPRDRRWDVRLIRNLVDEYKHAGGWARLLARMESDDCRALAERVVSRVLAGETPRNVSRELNKDKKPYVFPTVWDCRKVKKIALSKAAAGLRQYHGQVLTTTTTDEGGNTVSVPVTVTWTPIITEHEHRTLTARLTRQDRGKLRDGQRVKYWWSGIAECGVCGAPLSRSKERNGTGRYQCRKTGCVSRDQVRVDAWLMEQALLLLERPDAASVFRLAEHASKAEEAEKEVKTLRAELEGWRNAAGAGKVSPESFASIEPALLERLQKAQERVDRATVPPILSTVIGPNAREVMAQLDITQLRTVLRTIMRPQIHPTNRRVVNGLDTTTIDPGFRFTPRPVPTDGADAAA
ncbi:DNA invertase Pin-like site-specific DNA recombinase [Kibdelosporangium banguiense]|uniref:DNA invertase Pin-like site-specific DNA recombinase n=1 Tax=Kibdelosporangium banguiense TaxID=1365924 RepID=A0ABS4TN18_9PSEU|nr:recombinase family protein [Kibdelosporangium banguiense]MBP2325313.1 DNA invertase Pin-like site-specific DNA recombinase [Kibdelosporangium banguiense]